MCCKAAFDPASLSGSGTEIVDEQARFSTVRSASSSGSSPVEAMARQRLLPALEETSGG
jgi:hypothetical protein